ncbi:MAG: hypothetical protein P8X95_22605 [Anaerolineales bacterium]
MAKPASIAVRLERQPHRDAVNRVRQAYQRLHRDRTLVMQVEGPIIQSFQEVSNEPDCSFVCSSFNPATGARGDG